MKTANDIEGVALIFAIVFAFILPPVAVFIKRKCLDTSFWINVIFCLLAWMPAVLHAFYVIFFKEDDY